MIRFRISNHYIGLRDNHLNIFCFYANEDKSHLENNITKAFVNVLESMSDNSTLLRNVVNSLFNHAIPPGTIKSNFYLQSKPDINLVKNYPNKIMFAFSPTGKIYGIDIKVLSSQNESSIRKELIKEGKKKNNTANINEFVENEITEIMKIRKDRGSIPDGWLFIDVDGKPELVVAMENKLYDLNPYQLNNHIEKSLCVKNDKSNIIVAKKYSDIANVFKSCNTFICNQFVEYLVILRHLNLDEKDFYQHSWPIKR